MSFVATSSVRKIVLLLVFCAALLTLGVLMATYKTQDDPFRSYFGAAGCIVFGGLGAAVCITQIKDPFRLVIDGFGITWTQWSDETIPWSAISDIDVLTVSVNPFVGLYLREPGKYLTRRRLLNVAAPLNKRIYGADIYVPLNLLSTRSKDVAAAIDLYRPQQDT